MTMSNMKLENWRIVTLDSNFFIELYIYIYIYMEMNCLWTLALKLKKKEHLG